MRYYVKIYDELGNISYKPVEDNHSMNIVSMPCDGFWIINNNKSTGGSSSRCVWHKISDFPHHAKIGEVFRYVEDIEKVILETQQKGRYSISELAQNIAAMIANKVSEIEAEEIKKDLIRQNNKKQAMTVVDIINDLKL
jgi:hypothetical protein